MIFPLSVGNPHTTKKSFGRFGRFGGDRPRFWLRLLCSVSCVLNGGEASALHVVVSRFLAKEG